MKFKPIRFIPDDTRFPIMRLSRFGFFFSGLLSLASLLLFIFVGLNVGVDFKGGTVMTIRTAASNTGLPIRTSRIGTLVGVYLGDALAGGALPTNFDEAKTTDERLYAKVFHALLESGVAMAPGAYEALFVGLGHDDAVLDELERRVDRALSSIV